MTEQRKASDVLLSLERDVKELKSMVQNQDLLLKLLLQSIKKDNINKFQQKDVIADKKPNNVTQAKPIIPGLKPNIVMGPNGLQTKSEDEDLEFPEVNVINKKPVELEETLPKQEEIVGQRRTNRYNNDGNFDKAIPVRQKILYPDGKLVCLANVEIFDIEQKTIIQKLRTNATGEWIASLKPGQYYVNILKPKALNKPEVKLSFGIDVPNSNGPLELPSPEN